MSTPHGFPEPAAFSERQAFRSNGVAMAVLAGVVVACGGVFAAPTSDTGFAPVLVSLGVFGLVAIFLLFGELRVEVRSSGLFVRMIPLTKQHHFAWTRIQSCEARTYRPIREYGGWGVRWGRAGKAYNVRGNRGVQLEFRDGKRLLIGSQRAEELAEAIRARLGG